MRRDLDLLKWRNGHGYRLTHDWFRFPGKFHPPLVEHLLRSIKPSGVLDPMAGVGTVAVEAKSAGIPSLSLDIDPLSTFFTKAKITPISGATLRAAWKDLSHSLSDFLRCPAEIDTRMFRDIRVDAMRDALASLEASDLEDLSYWFRRYVLVDFARIDNAIRNGGLGHRAASVRRFFLACLLSSVRRISLADPSPVSGLEITKQMKLQLRKGYRIDVFGEFSRRVSLAIHRMDEFTSYLRQRGTLHTPTYVKNADCLDLLTLHLPADFHPDLVLFSPPYCNAIEYWRRHRLEYIMGRFLDETEIPALHRGFVGRRTLGDHSDLPTTVGYRPTDRVLSTLQRQKRSHKARVLSQYFHDMTRVLLTLFNYLPAKGHCIIVVGDSTTRGDKIPTVRTISWLGERCGFDVVRSSRYRIKNRTMQFPIESNSRIKSECIILFGKP